MQGTSNGNGHANGHALRRIEEPPEQTPQTPLVVELPAWAQALRASMNGAIKPDDLKEIMDAQVEKAKKGDRRAAQFVFTQAMKLSEPPKGLTVVQNNYYGGPDPRQPNAAPQGSEDKIELMRRRASAGLPLNGDHDKAPDLR